MKFIKWIVLLLIGIGVGILIGRYYFPREITMPERLQECEEMGGKYNFSYNTYSENYYEACRTLVEEIKL